jgi:hypothetical protein
MLPIGTGAPRRSGQWLSWWAKCAPIAYDVSSANSVRFQELGADMVLVAKDGAAENERIYSVVFRSTEVGCSFEVLNIAGERKTSAEVARDLLAAAKELELRVGRVDIV